MQWHNRTQLVGHCIVEAEGKKQLQIFWRGRAYDPYGQIIRCKLLKEHASNCELSSKQIWDGFESMQRQIEWRPDAPIHSDGKEQRTKEGFGPKQRLLLLREQFEAKEAEG